MLQDSSGPCQRQRLQSGRAVPICSWKCSSASGLSRSGRAWQTCLINCSMQQWTGTRVSRKTPIHGTALPSFPVRLERLLLQLPGRGHCSGQLLLFSLPHCTPPYPISTNGKASWGVHRAWHIHIDFHSGYTNCKSHKQWRNFPFALHFHQHELSLVLLISGILTDVH